MTNNRPDSNRNPLDIIGLFDDVTSGVGDWISNGTPAPGSIPGVVQQRYRDACDSWSNGLGWTTALNAPARAAMSNICGPWLDSQGSGDPVLNVPFTGGQCPGVEYDVTIQRPGWVRVDCDDGQERTQAGLGTITSEVYGPIGGLRREDIAQGDCGPSASRIVLDAFDENGDPVSNVVWPISVNPGFFSIGEIDASIVSVNRVDGQPDNCGNPDGSPGPNPNPRPNPGLDPEDEPFEREPGQPFIPMPPITDPYGEPVQLPNFPLPRVDGPSLFPEDEPPLAEPGEPGTPETVADDEEAEGEADEDEILTGVLVEIDSVPGFARTVQNVSTPTYIGACYVYLGWDGQLDLQPEGQFLVDGQFFAAVPGMTHWRVRSAVGYTLTITPYYAPKE